ncbi:hypothetical protein [Vagococcus hydrophili]|uniref:Role in replication n=1 Tax=Vagococcus hydrophili TaxID=2714947 RepID=A0A6G8ASP1_9ENTE|nr:hypothetical protein [Vagococcus hydrophili]QIL48091.1 hypothetical protein G7082_05975 [Vagococcus hydrophili]
MKATYKNKVVDVWEISRTGEQPDWVKEAFKKNYLYWSDNRLRILMSALNPSVLHNLKTGTVGTVVGNCGGYGMYAMGYEGDFLDATNHQLISSKKFTKHYTVIK